MWRYEYKMVIYGFMLQELRGLVQSHPKHFFERYPARRVNNIYFDTHDLSNYHDSLMGSAKRFKMRFRWYGESLAKIKGCLERKERSGALITKKIRTINHEFDLLNSNWQEIVSNINISLAGHIIWRDFLYACVPVIINSYYRYYYQTYDGSCRITIDCKQKVYDQRIYSKPNVRFHNPLSDGVILEIKLNYKSKVILDEITNYFSFRISQNSKYTSGVFWI